MTWPEDGVAVSVDGVVVNCAISTASSTCSSGVGSRLYLEFEERDATSMGDEVPHNLKLFVNWYTNFDVSASKSVHDVLDVSAEGVMSGYTHVK